MEKDQTKKGVGCLQPQVTFIEVEECKNQCDVWANKKGSVDCTYMIGNLANTAAF